MIEKALAQGANVLTAVKGFLVGAPAQYGAGVASTRSICDQVVEVDWGVAELFAANGDHELGHATLSGRLDCTSKLVEEQQAVATIRGTKIKFMSLTQFGGGLAGSLVPSAPGPAMAGGRKP